MSGSAPSPAPTPELRAQLALCLGALGVVFGDIGTSPLYTMRECIAHLPPMERTDGILGILSLMFWSILLVVNFKYLMWITRADNHGEGGIFALLALALPREGGRRRGLGLATLLILAGAALLYGDGMITPAISVLGAAEGFSTFSSSFDRMVVPIAVLILAGLFLFQSRGTHAIGRIFGPIMMVWFGALALLGAWHLFDAPIVYRALNPLRGLRMLIDHPSDVKWVLGSIVLTLTGAEALYADMGHFGRRYIIQAWTFIVLPGLLLNYFGQGAYALSHPLDATNPFFALATDGPMRLALVGLSIIAAVIASQALISGTYSLTRQAIQLGYFPRLKVLHTSAQHEGQIYVPLINWVLAIGTIWIVLEFRSSSNLAAAYGIAVTGTMTVTTFAFYRLTRAHWRWPIWQALGLCTLFGVVDLAFFAANFHKFADGGWLPMAIALGILAIMHTWKSGRNEIQDKVYGDATADLELSSIAKSKLIVRVPGSAVFMVATPKGTPLALLHHLKANKCLQNTVVLLTIQTPEVPEVESAERLFVESLGEGVWRAVGSFGYMESPDVSALIEEVRARGVPINPAAATYYFNREMILTGGNARMWEWQKRLYSFLSRNATPVKDYYQIMPTQIIEIGLPVQL